MLYALYNEILFRPLFNGLVFLTGVMPGHSVGMAVIALTVIVRSALFPLTHKSTKTQVKMKALEPDLAEIRKKFKDNKEEQAKQTMELYKKHGVSPFSGCLVMLLQLPILIALYQVFWRGLTFDGSNLYSFIAKPDYVNMMFLGTDLAGSSMLWAVLAGLTQFLQMKLASPPVKKDDKPSAKGSFQEDFTKAMQIQTTYVLPVFIGFISYSFPAAVALYWTTMNVFATVHESIVRVKARKLQYGSQNSTSKERGGDSS